MVQMVRAARCDGPLVSILDVPRDRDPVMLTAIHATVSLAFTILILALLVGAVIWTLHHILAAILIICALVVAAWLAGLYSVVVHDNPIMRGK